MSSFAAFVVAIVFGPAILLLGILAAFTACDYFAHL
jgi:hypothetical protein